MILGIKIIIKSFFHMYLFLGKHNSIFCSHPHGLSFWTRLIFTTWCVLSVINMKTGNCVNITKISDLNFHLYLCLFSWASLIFLSLCTFPSAKLFFLPFHFFSLLSFLTFSHSSLSSFLSLRVKWKPLFRLLIRLICLECETSGQLVSVRGNNDSLLCQKPRYR